MMTLNGEGHLGLSVGGCHGNDMFTDLISRKLNHKIHSNIEYTSIIIHFVNMNSFSYMNCN